MYPSTKNVVFFISKWSKNELFTIEMLCCDFNTMCCSQSTKSQMSRILSYLTRKGDVVRKVRGVYRSTAPKQAPKTKNYVAHTEYDKFAIEFLSLVAEERVKVLATILGGASEELKEQISMGFVQS
jgi:hypothetical protein